MQDVMNAYNASANVTAPAATTPMIQASITRPAVMVPQADPFRGSPAAVGEANQPFSLTWLADTILT